MVVARIAALVAAVLAGASAPVAGQQASRERQAVSTASTAGSAGRGADTKPIEDPKLIFEREVFTYPAGNRRDAFKPLDNDRMGPMFEDLSLRMIIFSDAPGQSVAVLADRSKKAYRLRRGQTLGNATLVEVTPTRAAFIVEDYGNRRREVLDLRPDTESEGA